MRKRSSENTPQLYARTAGFLYLIIIVLGGFAFGYVPGRLVSADVTVTAENLLAHESLWRAAIVADLVVVACAIPQLLCEYLLLRPVQRQVALLGVFFNLLSLSIESLSGLGNLAALEMLKGADGMRIFGGAQAQALASFAIGLHDYEVNVSFLFFGCFCVTAGYLIFRSAFLPRVLGVLMTLAGACYIANSISSFLGLAVGGAAGVPWLLVPAGLSELTLCLWLLIRGVDVARWREVAAAS